MTSHSFSYCEHCSQPFFSAVAAREAALHTSSLKVTVFLRQQNIKKCSTTRKGHHTPKKLSFQKKKKGKRNLTTSTSHSFSHSKRCSLRFFSAAAAWEARKASLRAASRFSALLAAASRFFCSNHGNCSASRTKLQAKSCSRVTRALATVICPVTNPDNNFASCLLKQVHDGPFNKDALHLTHDRLSTASQSRQISSAADLERRLGDTGEWRPSVV